jgi:hypothetical protein
MSRDRDQQGKAKNELRVELKYCEGCGGLGVRECGGGQVYCNGCAQKLAEVAVSKTTSRRPTLPVGKRSRLEDMAGSDQLERNHREAKGHEVNHREVNDREVNDRELNHREMNEDEVNEDEADDPDRNDLDAMAWTAGGAA